ncbi:hypothetical protein [Fibrobacter sp. HC4]|uniref:hypothetical protein n=1 Tax=Fibrobacter sp. HC4 TaxID=3239812 RepID=UPI0020195B73|nr:hypothetical protein [Fibrobacter succinogenes]MCL4101999.1 hypothetical protein [Fibrobacter succinogenes]
MFGIIGAALGAIGSAIGGICSGLAGVVGSLGAGIASIAATIGKIAANPIFGLVIQLVCEIAKVFCGRPEKETPEEMGAMMEEGAKMGIKPNDYKSTKEYLDALREKVKIDEKRMNEIRSNDVKCCAYKCVGAGAYMKDAQERLSMSIPIDVLKIGAVCKMGAEQLVDFARGCSASTSDISAYLNGKPTTEKPDKVAETLANAMKAACPEMSENQIYEAINKVMGNK